MCCAEKVPDELRAACQAQPDIDFGLMPLLDVAVMANVGFRQGLRTLAGLLGPKFHRTHFVASHEIRHAAGHSKGIRVTVKVTGIRGAFSF